MCLPLVSAARCWTSLDRFPYKAWPRQSDLVPGGRMRLPSSYMRLAALLRRGIGTRTYQSLVEWQLIARLSDRGVSSCLIGAHYCSRWSGLVS
jgi:hypothetical protein